MVERVEGIRGMVTSREIGYEYNIFFFKQKAANGIPSCLVGPGVFNTHPFFDQSDQKISLNKIADTPYAQRDYDSCPLYKSTAADE